jgi:UDP-glucose 4-epimerase
VTGSDAKLNAVRTVGVTGGAGFIGGHVIDQLRERGLRVVVFDHMGHHPRPGDDGVDTFLGDVRDATAVTELAAHVDGIIHLAAVLGTQETVGNPGPAAETNILGGVNVLNACRQYDLPLVYAGVGNHWMNNTYSTTKTTVERLLAQYRDSFGLRAAVVRPVNAYGPGQKAAPPFAPGKVRKITPAFICRALCGLPVEVYGDGSQVSDMVFVGDVAAVFVAALDCCDRDQVPAMPVEVGPLLSHTVREVAWLVVKLVEERDGATSPISYLPMRPGEKAQPDVPHEVLHDIDEVITQSWPEHAEAVRRVMKTLGTEVTSDTDTLAQVGLDAKDFVPLEDGLRATIDWFATMRGVTWSAPAAS